MADEEGAASRGPGTHRADPGFDPVGVLEEEPGRVELDGEPPGLERRLHLAPARALWRLMKCQRRVRNDSQSKSRRLERFRCSREREPHSRKRGRHGTRTGVERAIASGREGTARDTHAMPEDAVKLTPTVLWAQRKDRLLITIDLPNPSNPASTSRKKGVSRSAPPRVRTARSAGSTRSYSSSSTRSTRRTARSAWATGRCSWW